MQYSLGIDIGSTTVKTVLMGDGKILYEKYERHMSRVRAKALELLEEMKPHLEGKQFTVNDPKCTAFIHFRIHFLLLNRSLDLKL